MRRLVLAAMLLPLGHLATAAERPAANDMGKLLAYTINCTCVVGDRDWILEVYRQIFADAYGEAYANAIEAPLHNALADGWDRKMDLCERICELPVTRQLQLSLARADGGAVDASGVRAVLGPPPANEAAVAYVGTADGDAGKDAAWGDDQGTVATDDEDLRTAFPPQPSYCTFRNYAKGCTPPEEEARVVVVTPPQEEPVEAASAPAGDGGDGTPTTSAPVEAQEVSDVPVAAAQAPVEPDAEIDAGRTRSDFYEEAGTRDNWSSTLCRTSPSRPECRKAGGS